MDIFNLKKYDGARIGQTVKFGVTSGVILNFVGDDATIFAPETTKFHRVRISSLSVSSPNLILTKNLYPILAKFCGSERKFIAYANRISVPDKNVEERNRRKCQIDQFLQFLLFQARISLIQNPKIIKAVAENFAVTRTSLTSIVFSNSKIRHTFSDEKLFDAWKKLLSSANDPPKIKSDYNNDASQFSANLFAAGIARKAEKKSSPRENVPDEIKFKG